MPKRPCLYLALLVVTFGLSCQAHAALYEMTFLSTAENGGGTYVDNVGLGDRFELTFRMDNGGDSMLNQTWTATDIVSILFDFNDGAHRTVFDGGPLDSTEGSFVTDAGGTLTGVPSDWSDESVSVIETNSAQTPNAWYVNGGNDVYFTDDFNKSVGLPNSADDLIVANHWTIAPAGEALVSEPPTLALAPLMLAVAFHLRRRRSRATPPRA